MSGFVFGSATVITPDATVAVFERPDGGPLEDGYYDPAGNWIVSARPTRVGCPGFGVDGSGQPYFQPKGADYGETADLWVDPSTGLLWLEKLVDSG